LRALENALVSGRVHHAFLFAGTRGVGKTTIARILAKALNCEVGVSAEPCGQCSACAALDEGRFVDLIEVDAASRTGVDDTRDLLNNVQYMPSAGRFKVYLIDEVHMLSRQSFNALLKTLEEPPEHVKFLFATTDPQKLPVTVLSRCLQFNLKRLPTKQIVERMSMICDAEKISAEPAALIRLARAAGGSMRDALSLLDQSLAYGADKLVDTDVADMLGSMDTHRIFDLVRGFVDGDAPALLRQIKEIDELVPDYEIVLDELATALQRIAVVQVAGADALDEEELDDVDEIVELAGRVSAEQVQLFYQIAVTSRRDLGLAPDPKIGFEMALLRMLAFRPAEAPNLSGQRSPSPPTAPRRKAKPVTPNGKPARAAITPDQNKQPGRGKPATARRSAAQSAVNPEDLHDWPEFVAGLALEGAARQLAENSALESSSPFELRLVLGRNNEHLLTDQLKGRLISAVQDAVGTGLNLFFRIADEVGDTTAAQLAQRAGEHVAEARSAIDNDPNVQDLVELFDGEVVAESIQPRRSNSSVSKGAAGD
jgi:DNA polymerase-3 subunit gamma/tau